LPEQLKVLTKETFKAVLSKISEIVGKEDGAGVSFSRSFIGSLKTYDTFSDDFVVNDSKKGDLDLSNNKRFIGEKTDRGKFILERYLRIPESTDATISRQQGTYTKDVVAINNWEDFLDKTIDKPDTLIKSAFNSPWKFGMRLVYVSPSLGEEDATTPEAQLETNKYFKKFNLGGAQGKELNKTTVDKEKAYWVADKVTVIEGAEYKQFNTVVLASEEIDIGEFVETGNGVEITFEDVKGSLEEIFENNYRERLLARLSSNSDYLTLMEHSLFADRIAGMMAVYSNYVLNSEDVKFLFEGTKLQLRRLFETLDNIGDYTFKTDFSAAENAAEYQAQFNRIGNPSGPAGPDALYLAAITPILILKGIVELSDPNIFIASKIIAAANAGYLSPKFERVGDYPEYQDEQGRRGIKIEGENQVVQGISSEAVVTDGIFTKDQDTGQLLVKKDAVQRATGRNENGELETSWRIRPDLAQNSAGNPIIAYTRVMEVETEEVVPGTGIVRAVLDENGLPKPVTDSSGQAIIKSGPGVYGVRYSMGEQSLSERGEDIANSFGVVALAKEVSDQILQSFGAGEKDSEFDIVESEPVFPGESISLPYNIVSPALLPVNVFGLVVPFPLCGPPINPFLGAPQFLPWEPLLWQLPHYQQVTANSSVSRDVKKELNIDLSGFKNAKCGDEEETEE
jgi:hypothetical protein